MYNIIYVLLAGASAEEAMKNFGQCDWKSMGGACIKNSFQ